MYHCNGKSVHTSQKTLLVGNENDVLQSFEPIANAEIKVLR